LSSSKVMPPKVSQRRVATAWLPLIRFTCLLEYYYVVPIISIGLIWNPCAVSQPALTHQPARPWGHGNDTRFI